MPKEKVSKEEKIHMRIRRKMGWKFATVVLFALLLVSMFTGGFKDFFGAPTTRDMGAENAADEAISFINAELLQGQATATLTGVEDVGALYKVGLGIQGQKFESYITKDGRYLFPQGIDLTEEIEEVTTPTTGGAVTDCSDTITSKKPTVDLFVMSHCPFGTQIEKGMLSVLELLKDKIDFNLRFVYYAMHGATEVNEQLNQYCIQKEQNDKLLDYLTCFLEAGKGEDCLTKSKINKVKLEACVEATDNELGITEKLEDQSTWLNGRYPLFDIDKTLNEKYGIRGSPGLVINGQTASSGRDPASLLSAICCAFDEKPAECEETLSTASPSPGFGLSGTGSGSTGSCG